MDRYTLSFADRCLLAQEAVRLAVERMIGRLGTDAPATTDSVVDIAHDWTTSEFSDADDRHVDTGDHDDYKAILAS